MSMGYLNRNEGYGSVNQGFVDDFPQIAGVAGYNVPPQITFGDGFTQYGSNAGDQRRQHHHAADVHHQRHADLDAGRAHAEVRDGVPQDHGEHPRQRQPGRKLQFPARGHRPRRRQQRQPDRELPARGRRQRQLHLPSGRLGVPAPERLDPARRRHVAGQQPLHPRLRPALGLLLAVVREVRSLLVLRSDRRQPRRRRPSRPPGLRRRWLRRGELWRAATRKTTGSAGFAPRLGAVYSINDKTILRSGWGIFYTQAFYPRLGRRHLAGRFLEHAWLSSTLGGIQPAFYLDQGFPQGFQQPPDIRSDYKNGQGILYRPLDANERPYAHQWNISVDRELGHNLSLSVAYVGSAGRRLPSSIEPINAIDPAYLSMGDRLNDEFQPGMTSLNGVALPYPGWVEQMTGCAPSVAQALRPYPQVLRQPAGPEREQRRRRTTTRCR